jgi:hypothetical protein
MPLMIVITAVITVLHSTEVVHRVVIILASRITVVQTSTLTHFRGVRYDITIRLFNGFP